METQKMPGVFDLLKKSLNLYKNNWRELALIGFIPFVFAIVPNLITSMAGSSSTGFVAIFIAVIIAGIFGIASSVLNIVNSAVFIKSIDNSNKGLKIDVNELYKKGFEIFFPILWVSILSVLVVLASSIFLFVPGMILAVMLSYSMYFLVLEDSRGLKALTKSFYYVKGNWWKVFGRSLGISAIFLAIYIFAFIIFIGIFKTFSLGAPIFEFVDGKLVSLIPIWLNLLYRAIISFIAYTIMVPILMSFSYFIYESLKSLKPEPSDADLATPKKWFTGLSIFGVIVPFLLMILGFVAVIIGMTTVSKARMNAKVNYGTSYEQQIDRQLKSSIDTTIGNTVKK